MHSTRDDGSALTEGLSKVSWVQHSPDFFRVVVRLNFFLVLREDVEEHVTLPHNIGHQIVV